MKRRQSTTNCKVHIVKLSLSAKQLQQCYALQKESARCYSDMIVAHVESRTRQWLSEGDLKQQFKGQYKLYSQTIQAIAEDIQSSINSARTNREREFKTLGYIETEYPSKPKNYHTVTWKQECIRIKGDKLDLSNGRGNESLTVSLPIRYRSINIIQAELVWDSGTYYLHITEDTGIQNPVLLRHVKSAGIDLGEIHIAACTIDDGKTLVVSGRLLRSVKQLRNKKHANLSSKQKKCNKGSRRWKKYQQAKNKISSKFNRQQRDILQKASRQIVDFCHENKVANLYIGDVRDCADEVALGRKTNQKLSQWAHGKFYDYTTQKSRSYGMNNHYINEAYSSKTCSICGHVKKSSVVGRMYKCTNPECKAKIHRDGNGGANICSKGKYGVYSKVQISEIKYLQPLFIRKCSSPSEPRQVATGCGR